MTASGPSVWIGRALQAESDDLALWVLRFCIRPFNGTFVFLAIMVILARSISFASRPLPDSYSWCLVRFSTSS